jgi:hypothetical protein
MGYASLSGRATTSSRNPRAHAICDRCGFRYNHLDLKFQFDWAGASLINKRMLVCNPCYDTPQNQLRAIILPADPMPIMNPRTEPFASDETNTIVASAGSPKDPITGIPIYPTVGIATENGQVVTTQPIGPPTGFDENAVMSLYQQKAYRVNLNPTSIIADGTNTVTVNCASVHNLSDNDQIAVQGLSNKLATGFYSVTIRSATSFTYQTNNAITAGNLLQGTTLMVTALVGLPYDYNQIPETGPLT